jgi:hypothetical protein
LLGFIPLRVFGVKIAQKNTTKIEKKLKKFSNQFMESSESEDNDDDGDG